MSEVDSSLRQEYLLYQAEQAQEEYLRYGNSVPPQDALQKAISKMRQAHANPMIRMTCMGAYLDLAKHGSSTDEQRAQLVDKAVKWSGLQRDEDWEFVSAQDLDKFVKCGIYSAYAPKFRQAVLNQPSTLDTEAELFANLLNLGRRTLQSGTDGVSGQADANAIVGVRGLQFEIGAHLLNARFNLKHGEIMQSAWPSLPREDDPHDFIFKARTGWDVAFSTGDFWHQEDCHFVQLKGVLTQKAYDESITVIAGREHLGTSTTADIITAAVKEVHSPNQAQRQISGQRLDMLEKAFMTQLGWQY